MPPVAIAAFVFAGALLSAAFGLWIARMAGWIR